jgi:hypothetical protein
MAQFDEDTKSFMEKVSEDLTPNIPKVEDEPPEETLEHAARKGLVGLRGLKTHGMGGVAKNILGSTFAHQLFDKTGGVSVLSTYNYLNNVYNNSWWDWEPETIWKVLKEDEGIDATSEVKNLVMALQTILKSNAAHEGWHVFENVCQAFNGNTVDFSTVQPAELDEIALTLAVLEDIRPKQEFDEEIWIYIAACARNAGVVYLPPDLFGGSEDCQKYLDDMNVSGHDLRDQVKRYWGSGNLKSSDPALQIQLARLSEIKDYLGEHYG